MPNTPNNTFETDTASKFGFVPKISVLDEDQNIDVETVLDSGNNEDSEEPITIVQEVEAIDKNKETAENEQNESLNEQR